MISNLFKSLRLTIAFCLFFSVFYIFVLWLFAQVAGPNKGNAELVTLNGKVVGAANVGQNFTQDIYFWGRPSHAGDGYDASSSAGSNKGPSNEEHLALLEERMKLVTRVSAYKQRTGKAIYDPEREQALLDKVGASVLNPEYKEAIVASFADIMKRSRIYQASKLEKSRYLE